MIVIKNIVCNVRLTEQERDALRIAVIKHKTTVQGYLYKCVIDLITVDSIKK